MRHMAALAVKGIQTCYLKQRTPSPDSDLEYQSALLASRTIQTVPLLASAVSLVSTNTLPPADTGGTRHVSIDGQELTFNASSVPDPPKGLRYSGDKLDSLFSDWYRSDHVKIEGVGIPIQHWPLIYSTRAGFKKNAWTVHRSTWHNWKYIMEEYESLGSNRTAFWTKHINTDGTRMSYNQILDSLKADRKRVVKAKDAPLAAQAKMFFNGDLTAAKCQRAVPIPKGRYSTGLYK
ncbi:hypothetical protein EW026_g2836 [Hermanssonia centrifuga]|uniref:Uncharacterized protein n=1 Tax=Hermanssonia centrifuga TaxID=98765 RepID=A0A4S4KM08_9APHY|nr:hypothetical protein EW026_g2836 [Hermanssonia centrifuga]